MKNINQILEFLDIKNISKNNFQIKSLYLDSRKVDSKSAFIALKGKTTDGNKYIETVISKGVNLVITDTFSFENMNNIFYVKGLKNRLSSLAIWFYNYKKTQNIIGITGTNGKTSISHYIAQFLYLNKQQTLLLGTNGNGLYPNLKKSSHTTMDILSLYDTINSYSFNNRNIKSLDHLFKKNNLVLEVSSHSLDQKRIEGLDFDIAVFTNLSHEHLDYHKNMNRYFQAKAKLFLLDSLKKSVINIDTDYGKKLYDICNSKVITVSLTSNQAEYYLNIKSIENMKTIFELYISQKYMGTYNTSLVGKFNLMNLALSFAALDEDYITIGKYLNNINNIKAVKGRMEVIKLSNGAKVIIDYAHTPDALEKVLQTLKYYSQQDLWIIFGCGGDRDIAKRPQMAKIAEKYANKVIVTEDNNRFENINNIFKDIKNGFNNANRHKFISSRIYAIKYAIEQSNKKDIILLTGKGHECYLDNNGYKEHFDEREIIKQYK